MPRCKKKATRFVHVDRISNLPSDVIDIILSKLPFKEVVRASILSTKWRYMWNSVRTLEFEEKFFDDNEFPINAINDVLLLHDGPVYKFTFCIPYYYKMRIGCLNTWIQFLSRRGVKDLSLMNHRLNPYQISPHIFSCQDLTQLHLKNFELSLPSKFYGFKSLTELYLDEIRVESGALESLILGCPCLEQLTIYHCDGFECINVSAPCVKKLLITTSGGKPICFKNVKNLIDLTLFAGYTKEGDSQRHRVLFDPTEGLPKLERLCLGGDYIQMFYEDSIPQALDSSINSLKYLELKDDMKFDEKYLWLIISLLESSPNLVELRIQTGMLALGLHSNHLNEIGCNSCSLSQLKTVEMRVEIINESLLVLTRFLLANASSLETLKCKVWRYVPDNVVFIKQELSRTKRASHGAKVEFFPPNYRLA